MPTPDDVEEAMAQLVEHQEVLDYDTKEWTIELLIQKLGDEGEESEIFVPTYQRDFQWDDRRQCRLIETILAGLPVPYLFFADMEDGRLEVVDGRQRLGTCKAFMTGGLALSGLERLDRLNGFTFDDLNVAQRRRFKNRSIRAVVLSQKVTEEDRRDLFDRINTGSLSARPAEIRRGAQSGPVSDLIDELAQDSLFSELCPLTEADRKKRDAEERVARFFAFSDGLEGYRDRIAKFTNDWLRKANLQAHADPLVVDAYRDDFANVMKFVEAFFPHGFAKKPTSRTTPRVRFDAIATGVLKALRRQPDLLDHGPEVPIEDWLNGDDFFNLTTSSAANVRSRILNRQEYVEHMLLGESDAAAELIGGDSDD